MPDFFGFIWAGLAGGSLTALLLSIAGYLGKNQLAHWLNKDIERIKFQHQQDLAAANASYARELESYRTSLIAQTEGLKAQQDVKKVMAVRIAEMKFEAIKQLQDVCAQIGMTLLYARDVREVQKHVNYYEMASQGGALHGAFIKAKPFLSTNERDLMLRFINDYTERLNLIGRALQQEALIDSDADELLNQLLHTHSTCEQVVYQHIVEMLSMQDTDPHTMPTQ